jgi:hypothetical protein
MPRAGTGISKDDIVDADIVDAEELGSSGSTVYRTAVTVVSTTTGTNVVVISPGGLMGEVVPTDVPSQVGDKVIISGTAAAGTYHIDTIVNDTTFTTFEPVVTTVGGLANFVYASGALRVGFDPTGTPTVETNIQDALEYALNNASGISATVHRTLLQLIHFIDQGPALGFTTGATRTTTGTAFPSQVLWRRADSTKLVEKNITYTGAFPTTIEWKLYDDTGSVVLETVTDVVTYSGAFETSRVRTIA